MTSSNWYFYSVKDWHLLLEKRFKNPFSQQLHCVACTMIVTWLTKQFSEFASSWPGRGSTSPPWSGETFVPIPDNVSVSAFTLSKVSSFEMWVRTTHSTSHSLGRFSVGFQIVMYTSTKNHLSHLRNLRKVNFLRWRRYLTSVSLLVTSHFWRDRFREFLEGWLHPLKVLVTFWWYGCFQKYGKTPKSSILKGFSIIFTIHFGVPYFWKHPYIYIYRYICSG